VRVPSIGNLSAVMSGLTYVVMLRLRSASGAVMLAPRSVYVAPTRMVAGLSPFTCNAGGVAEESVEDAAAPLLDDGGGEMVMNFDLAIIGVAILCAMIEAFEVAPVLVLAAMALLHWF
jgi:hypothetical protein